jgi:hypothetical protein
MTTMPRLGDSVVKSRISLLHAQVGFLYHYPKLQFPSRSQIQPSVETDQKPGSKHPEGRSHATMKELRARLFALGWGLAVLVATCGWIYFIVRVGRLFVSWLVT